jgi:hypothetical protein
MVVDILKIPKDFNSKDPKLKGTVVWDFFV